MSVSPENRPGRRGKENNNERAEVRYFKGEEQFERWRKEFVQHQDYELKLASVSKLNYEPVDYQSLLIREPFPELILTDYSHLIGKAKSITENKYFYPIGARIGAIICLLGVLVILFSPVTLLITAALGVAAAVSLYFTIRDRDEAVKKAEQAALDDITERNNRERQAYEEKKREHDEKENARITLVEQLTAGDPVAVRSRLDEALNRLKLPVIVEITATILANIPSFEVAYAAGIAKNEFSDDCVLAVKIPRDKIDCLNRASNAVAAIQTFEGVYECDTSLALYPVDMITPPEFEDVEKQILKNLRVRIFK